MRCLVASQSRLIELLPLCYPFEQRRDHGSYRDYETMYSQVREGDWRRSGRPLPFGERHLKRIASEFVVHDNRGRPHSALGPGIPEPTQAEVPVGANRHQFPTDYVVKSTAILGGLHHEYRLEKEAA